MWRLLPIQWPIKMVWIYFVAVTGIHSYWPYYVPKFAPSLSNVLAWSSTQCLFQMMFFTLIIFLTNEKTHTKLVTFMKWYLAFDAVTILCGWQGIFSAITYDATLMACLMLFWNPGRKRKLEFIGLGLFMATIIYTRARNASMIIGIMLVSNILQFLWHTISRKAFFRASIAGLTVALASLYLYWPKILSDPRIGTWKSFIGWWSENADTAYGTGLGSIEWIGPFLDPGPQYHDTGMGFYEAHNDWVQILIESGVIGFALAIFGYIYVATKLRGRDLTIWLGIGFGMIFYYPTHSWIVQILALIIMTRMEKKNAQNS